MRDKPAVFLLITVILAFGAVASVYADTLEVRYLEGMVSARNQNVWVALDISGPKARDALERICPIDLHDDAFAIMDLARTTMEHLGVIILRTDEERWRLLSASSSARSFLHALETSVKNVS